MPSKQVLANPEISVTINGREYVIDEETGEILDWPAGEANHMDRLIELAIYADDSQKAWDTAAKGFRAAIKRKLTDAEIGRARGSAGDANLIGSNADRVPGGEGFMQWLRDVEFPPSEYSDLLLIAQEFNVKAFVFLCSTLGIDPEDIEHAIERKPYTYVRLARAKPEAPTIRRSPSRENA